MSEKWCVSYLSFRRPYLNSSRLILMQSTSARINLCHCSPMRNRMLRYGAGCSLRQSSLSKRMLVRVHSASQRSVFLLSPFFFGACSRLMNVRITRATSVHMNRYTSDLDYSPDHTSFDLRPIQSALILTSQVPFGSLFNPHIRPNATLLTSFRDTIEPQPLLRSQSPAFSLDHCHRMRSRRSRCRTQPRARWAPRHHC